MDTYIMRPHVPDKKHNNHIAAKYMALHVPETYLHVKALRLLCCTLYDTARRYLTCTYHDQAWKV